jgi:hypothetical protein
LPPEFQEAAALSSFDPAAGVPPGFNTWVPMATAPLMPPAAYPGSVSPQAEPWDATKRQHRGIRLGSPGRMNAYAVFFACAGSPTLTPNESTPARGAERNILVAASTQLGVAGPPGFLGVAFPAAGLGLVSGGPGCAPPA